MREPNEYQTARIPGTTLIPLGEVVGRKGEIDESRETVVHCKLGGRSAKAIEALQRAGFQGRLLNLKGGITAWSNEVDRAAQVLNAGGGRGPRQGASRGCLRRAAGHRRG